MVFHIRSDGQNLPSQCGENVSFHSSSLEAFCLISLLIDFDGNREDRIDEDCGTYRDHPVLHFSELGTGAMGGVLTATFSGRE